MLAETFARIEARQDTFLFGCLPRLSLAQMFQERLNQRFDIEGHFYRSLILLPNSMDNFHKIWDNFERAFHSFYRNDFGHSFLGFVSDFSSLICRAFQNSDTKTKYTAGEVKICLQKSEFET